MSLAKGGRQGVERRRTHLAMRHGMRDDLYAVDICFNSPQAVFMQFDHVQHNTIAKIRQLVHAVTLHAILSGVVGCATAPNAVSVPPDTAITACVLGNISSGVEISKDIKAEVEKVQAIVHRGDKLTQLDVQPLIDLGVYVSTIVDCVGDLQSKSANP